MMLKIRKCHDYVYRVWEDSVFGLAEIYLRVENKNQCFTKVAIGICKIDQRKTNSPCCSVVLADISDSLGPVSISEKMPYCKISSSLKTARFVFKIVRSL